MKNRYKLAHLAKYALLTTLTALFFCSCSFAQKKQVNATVAKSPYKLYIDPQHRYQFEIPAQYNMKSYGNGNDYSLMAVTKADKKIFAFCQGIVIDLTIEEKTLELATEGEGTFKRGADGEYYFKSPFSDSLFKATKIVGPGFIGLKRIIPCRVGSSDPNDKDTTIADGCETVFFSNGKVTIILTTSGIEIDDEDYERMIKTLKFFN
jgi:hypothetical protein